MNFDASHWLAYREANMRFADVVASMAQAGDMVWVQDYHLMLLPMLLRSMISGESAQPDIVRNELGRVKEGMRDDVVHGVLGMKTGVAPGVDEGLDMETLDEESEDGEGLAMKSKDPLRVASRQGRSGRPSFKREKSGYEIQEEIAKSKGKEGIKIGFFLHTPFPSSEIYR